MDGRGTVCAHCAGDEAEEPCSRCRQIICISCLLDRVPCRHHGRPILQGPSSASADALATLAACGIEVAGERLLALDVPLWLIREVRVGALGDPVVGRPDVLSVSVEALAGSVEVLRRSEAKDVDEVHAAAAALALLVGTDVVYE
jgi:hypothetical protein